MLIFPRVVLLKLDTKTTPFCLESSFHADRLSDNSRMLMDYLLSKHILFKISINYLQLIIRLLEKLVMYSFINALYLIIKFSKKINSRNC